ncbi:retrovirus-related pol polyprotein from transposon TNT 1-94 [Tanacetum coccineum]
MNHNIYTLVIVDEYSRYPWLFCLKKKSDATDCIMSFIRKIENLNEVMVKELRSDNGTEFKKHKLEEFYDEKWISQNFSFPCTSEQNAIFRNPSQSIGNDDYLPYVFAFNPFPTYNIIIPDTVIPSPLNINSSNESPEFSIANDHPVHNEPNAIERAKNHNDTSESQTILSNDDPIIEVEPSPTIISPSVKINHDTPAPQDKWSRDKNIPMVNILGESQVGVTTRSKVKDSEAALMLIVI